GAVAGTIGTIGFFGFQFSYWLHSVFGIPDVLFTQVFAVGGLIIVVTISAVTGIEKGIQFLSKLNIWLALGIAAFILLVGLGAVAGTIGTIGFVGFQFSYWLHSVFGIPDVLFTQVFAVGGLIIVVTISAVTGIEKGIQFLSKLNIWLALGIAAFILLLGPGG